MNRKIPLAAALVLLAACSGSSDSTPPPALDTPAAINTYLDGKTWVMQGADIPPYPNGYSENVNYGAATQCYDKVLIGIAAGTWSVTSTLGTLTGAPTVGSTGTCDNATPSTTLAPYASTTVLVENVHGNGDCFDLTVTYTGFAQSGRGKFSPDGKTMTLELFFAGQATGATCAAGAVGSATVTLNGAAFTGNALQVYRLQ